MTSRNEFRALVVFSVTAGFTGGALAAWLTLNAPAIAQEVVGQSPAVVEDTVKPQPAVISAQEFRLIDQKGMPHAVLGFSSDGEPSLTMQHPNHSSIIWLGISEESGLAVRDVDGKTRLVLSLDTAGIPSLVLRDRDHNTRAIHP